MTTKTFPGNFENLESISNFVVEQAREFGFSSKEIYAIQTAVDEACSNIIDHAYGGENLGVIKISVKNTSKGLKIILYDNGEPFEPDAVPEPDLLSPLGARKERGLGVFFIRQLMDRVIFEFSPGKGNKLTLEKYKGS
jgi:anti-sigma regulatory factor (Ser/Thr protein kinase)